MNRESYLFNGIDGATGGYLRQAQTPQQIARRARLDPRFGFDPELSSPSREHAKKGLPEWVKDAGDLAQTGWGVIFPRDADPAVREALSKLLAHRRRQATGEHGCLFREFTGPIAYHENDSKLDFLERLGVGPGPPDPKKVPYYLLLVGGPEKIPYEFQVQLDVQYAVGRLDFDKPAEYRVYACNVVKAELADRALPDRRVTFFATANSGDSATDLSAHELVEPLARGLEEGELGWPVERILRADATKVALARVLSAPQPPALLFTACHGLGFAYRDERQRNRQGALVCQEWPGPGHPPSDEHCLFADDLDGVRPAGLISFHFACHSAGTPAYDAFDLDDDGRPLPIASQPFTARLPQRLLAGGALAVIGHLERAWTWSFQWHGAGRQIGVFENALARLLRGYPVGWAMEYFNQRYGELATDLDMEIRRAPRGNDRKVARLWTARNDARNYVVLGDPAVRVQGSEGRP